MGINSQSQHFPGRYRYIEGKLLTNTREASYVATHPNHYAVLNADLNMSLDIQHS